MATNTSINSGQSLKTTDNVTFSTGTVSKLKFPTSNTRIGDLAGDAITTGLENVFVGNSSGASVTSGDGNTLVGFNSGGSINTGGFNTAIGQLAGGLLTTGTLNTLVGASCGESLTTGGSNTFVGYAAGALFTTQSGATAVGESALSLSIQPTSHAFGYQAGQNSTGSRSTYIGYRAGLGSVGASLDNDNVAIGHLSLSEYTTGASFNVCVGIESGRDITTGSQNVYIGSHSGEETTIASQNAGVGEQALPNITTGSQNVGFGYQAGFTITTGNFNTCIGRGSNVSSATSENRIAIGNNTVATADFQIAIGNSSQTTAIFGSLAEINSTYTKIGTSVSPSVSGAGNTILGKSAAATLTTGTNCVIIGDSADVGSATALNRIAIGQGATCSNNNQVIIGNSTCASWASNNTGSTNLGTLALPFGTLALGASVTNAVRIFPSTYAAARVVTIPEVGTDSNFMLTESAASVYMGGFVKIQSQTASASATIDFSLPTGFSSFQIIASGVKPVSDGVDFWIRTSTDGGATYDSGAANYSWAFTTVNDAAGTGVTADSSSTHITIQSGLGNNTNEFSNYNVTLFEPSASRYFHLTTEATGTNTTGVLRRVGGMGVRLAAADVTNIRFMFDTGNISVGKFTLYGNLA